MPDLIKFYKIKDPFGFLGNFFPSKFFIFGRWWKNVESPYQAMKCASSNDFNMIHACATPKEARDLGQKVTLVPHWDEIRDDIMEQCCMAKFLQNKDLLEQLMDTGDAELQEDSPVDNYWGIGADGTGQNKLGRILMRIRGNLK